MKASTKLRQMMADKDIHAAPGAYDGLTARLVEQAGFGLVYASGGGDWTELRLPGHWDHPYVFTQSGPVADVGP